jgi:GcrA cell cycle regulator
MREDGWTDERVKILSILWRDGWSLSALGHKLNVSRNAVSGKLYRMGFLKGEGGTPKPMSAIPRGPRSDKPRTRSDGSPVSTATRQLPTPADAALRSFNDVSGPSYSILDLGFNDCRFPIGDPLESDFAICAAPKYPGSSWCFHHHRIVFPPR